MSHKSGWYVVSPNKFPHRAGKCMLCQKTVTEDDVVYVKRLSIPTGQYNSYYNKSISVEKYVLQHKDCMIVKTELAPASPLTAWESIREQLANGKGLFDGE